MAQARSARVRGGRDESTVDGVTEAGETVPHENDVRLVGRLAASATSRVLPSGDELVSFRLVVERDPTKRGRAPTAGGGRSATVDAIECVVWRRAVARSLARAQPGAVLEVTGALRRRFWRSPSGAASRTEVEVTRVRRLQD